MGKNISNEELLKEKVQQSYNGYIYEWQEMTPSQLIKMAEEISAVKAVYDCFMCVELEPQQIYDLLCFCDPLKVVCNQYMGNIPDKYIDDVVVYNIEVISDNFLDYAEDYPMDENYYTATQSQQMS